MSKRISDEAVKKSTGKNWEQWFSILNKAGAKKMEHKQVAELLYQKYSLSLWWSQMVTVQYEQEMKGRKKHETALGFQISKSMTIPISVVKLFNAVNAPAKRVVWLKDPGFTISKSVQNKSVRGKWVDKKTIVEFQFNPKDKSRTQIVVQHSKISSAAKAANMKLYWGKNLLSLKKYLEKN
jgi:hypothetical protein